MKENLKDEINKKLNEAQKKKPIKWDIGTPTTTQPFDLKPYRQGQIKASQVDDMIDDLNNDKALLGWAYDPTDKIFCPSDSRFKGWEKPQRLPNEKKVERKGGRVWLKYADDKNYCVRITA